MNTPEPAAMDHTLFNDDIRVVISEIGGELVSAQNASGTEYLWQPDPAYWDWRSFHIFPYVGRLTDEAYRLNGREYHMGIHGILPGARLQTEEVGSQTLTLSFIADEVTLRSYPVRFAYYQRYRLVGNRLDMMYEVFNQDAETMYFGIGAHPAFNVPLSEGLAFTDYELSFGRECRPLQVGMTDACFLRGDLSPYPLDEGKKIRLNHGMFDRDAIILTDISSEITLRSPEGGPSLSLLFEDFPYLMLWTMPGAEAPYLCIEPVSSLSSRQGVVEDLEAQGDLISLPAGGGYRGGVSITFA